MTSSWFIRAGGLVAMAGGLAATSLGLLYVLQARGVPLDATDKALQKGHYENPVTITLLAGALAATVSLHLLQRRHHDRRVSLVPVAAFAGVAMLAAGILVGELVPALASLAVALLVGGILVASAGIVGLGIVTINAGVLPRWCGAALIAGSPPGAGILLLLSNPLVAAGAVPGEIGWALTGIPWLLVGYAVFQTGFTRQELPHARRMEVHKP